MDKKPNIPEANSPLMPLSEQDPVKEAVIKVATARKLSEVKRGIPSHTIPLFILAKEDESFGNDDDNNYFTLGGEA
jgi:hypothetical protein